MTNKKRAYGPFLLLVIFLPPSSVEATVMFEPGVVKTFPVEISPMVPFEERTVVFEVETIPVVAVPGRIVIISISGEIGFTNGWSGIVSAHIDPWYGDAYPNVGANVNLRIAGGGDEAGGYEDGEDK
jgi:hypothetical protein